MSTPARTPIAEARSHAAATPAGTEPLRPYLFVLAPRTRSRRDAPLIHYVVEETVERAIQVCGQSHPDHTIVAVRDATDSATAA